METELRSCVNFFDLRRLDCEQREAGDILKTMKSRVFLSGFLISLSLAAASRADEAPKELVRPALNEGGPAKATSAQGSDTAGATTASQNKTGSGTGIAMEGSTNDKVAKIPTTAEDERTQGILNSLSMQSGWFPGLKIHVVSGMVTLEGHVKDADQLAWLAKTADRLPTVVAVINKAKVDAPPVTDLTPAWHEFLRMIEAAKKALPLLFLAAVLATVLIYVGRHLHRGVRSIWGHHVSNPFLLSTVSKISMIPVWVLFFYLVLQTAGLSALATTIIGGTGAIGIVLGFAFKDIAENYLSGFLLAIRSPFTKGDDIQIAGYDGYVQSLNMRGTTILDYDGNLILIPNSMVIQSVIRNRTTNPKTRISFTIGISRTDSFARAQALILQVLNEASCVLKNPPPIVVAGDLKTSTLEVQAYFWIDGVKDSSLKVKSKVLTNAKEKLLANGISLPDPQREIVFTDAIKVRMVGTDAKASEEAKSGSDAPVTADQQETSSTRHSEIEQLGSDGDILDRASRAKGEPAPSRERFVSL